MTTKKSDARIIFFRLGRLQTLLMKILIVREVVCFPIACHIYNWAKEANPTLGCSIEISRDIYIYIYTRKMVPITGRASASFSSMLKLKRIGNE